MERQKLAEGGVFQNLTAVGNVRGVAGNKVGERSRDCGMGAFEWF